MHTELTNWSKSSYSHCFIHKARDIDEIANALASARTQRLSVIPHGAGHSYTDAALNTAGIVIDLTPMRKILSWDASQGILRTEPGATVRDILQLTLKDGWGLFVSPSTSEVTIGGCAAMNVIGRNAWNCGPFGAHILSLDVLLASGEICTLSPEQDPQLFHAFIGSMGLLGIITSITIQLRHIYSGYVMIRTHTAASLREIFNVFTDEQGSSDFMEAWLDGLAQGPELGRGIITCGTLGQNGNPAEAQFPSDGGLKSKFVSLAGRLGRPALQPAVQMANRAYYWRAQRGGNGPGKQRSLIPYLFWSPALLAGYPALFPGGVETFQAFVPGQYAKEIFDHVLRYSQEQGCMPIWCIVKRHRRDPFLLSYQVDGYSLELNYPRTHQSAQALQQVLEHMIGDVIQAGGRFYLAKDHFMNAAQYRQSVGDEAVTAFLGLKKRFDPESLLQSDLFRRVFVPVVR